MAKPISPAARSSDAADFTNARFYSPPDFDAATKDARIDFTGAHIGFVPPGRLLHWTSDSKVPVRLRALRKIAEETKNHDLERDLYIEERKAERGVYLHQLLERDELKQEAERISMSKKSMSGWNGGSSAGRAMRTGSASSPNADKLARLFAHLLWIAVMGVYWALADYGRSFVRPAAWLVASVFFFDWRYNAILAPLMPKAGSPMRTNISKRWACWRLATPCLSSARSPSTARSKNFCSARTATPACLPIPPEGFQLLVIGQNLLSITSCFSSASHCAIISRIK